MAEVDIAPSFGQELKDGFKPVNVWLFNGIAWLEDVQQFYRERSAIEREYSQKLSALAKKYFDRKNYGRVFLDIAQSRIDEYRTQIEEMKSNSHTAQKAVSSHFCVLGHDLHSISRWKRCLI